MVKDCYHRETWKNTMCYNMQRMLKTFKKSDGTSNAGTYGECQNWLYLSYETPYAVTLIECGKRLRKVKLQCLWINIFFEKEIYKTSCAITYV